MIRLYRVFLELNIYILIFTALIIDLGLSLAITSLPFVGELEGAEALFTEDTDPAFWFFFAVLIVPLLETAIFQSLIIFLVNKFFKHYIWAVIASAIFFGLNHFYSIAYIIITFFSGFIFAFLYIIVQKRKESAFLIVWLIHALNNFAAFIQDLTN